MEVARGLGLISASFLGGRGLLHSSPILLHLTQPHTNWSVRLTFELTCDANRYQGPKRRYVYIWQCVSYCPMAQPSFIEPDERPIVCMRMFRHQYHGHCVSGMRCSKMRILPYNESAAAVGSRIGYILSWDALRRSKKPT